jgi:hypothetical protein
LRLSAARALRRADVDVTVDRTNQYLLRPLLHQVATGHELDHALNGPTVLDATTDNVRTSPHRPPSGALINLRSLARAASFELDYADVRAPVIAMTRE